MKQLKTEEAKEVSGGLATSRIPIEIIGGPWPVIIEPVYDGPVDDVPYQYLR